MVDGLVERGCVETERVEAAFRHVVRSHFLPGHPLDVVYDDESVVTKRAPDGLPLSSSTEPGLMARMLEQLGVDDGDAVLEVGAGTGYNAALLAHLAGPAGSVTTVELDSDTAAGARRNLRAAGEERVRVVDGDGWQGAPDHAPYDRIVLTAGVSDLSPHWVDQLRRDGILLVPLWLQGGVQVSVSFRPEGRGLCSVSVRPCGFMRLRGPRAGPETYAYFGEWSASLDTGEMAAALRMLAAEQPCLVATDRLPAPPPGWVPRAALDVPGAVSVFREADHAATLAVLDPSGRSLVLLDDDRVLVFGGDEALPALRAAVRTAAPLDLAAIEIRAYPHDGGADEREPAAWMVMRPHYLFDVRERTPT